MSVQCSVCKAPQPPTERPWGYSCSECARVFCSGCAVEKGLAVKSRTRIEYHPSIACGLCRKLRDRPNFKVDPASPIDPESCFYDPHYRLIAEAVKQVQDDGADLPKIGSILIQLAVASAVVGAWSREDFMEATADMFDSTTKQHARSRS